MTAALAALRVRHRPGILRELRGRSFAEACVLVADCTDASETAVRSGALLTLAEYVRSFTDAQDVLRWFASRNHKLAVWGACACAREALRFVPESELRPLRANLEYAMRAGWRS